MKNYLPCLILLGLAVAACTSNNSSTPIAAAGSSALGGSSAVGSGGSPSSSASGAPSATGGSSTQATGGATDIGGSSATAGMTTTIAGASATGGAGGTAGGSDSGGASSSAGTSAAGGSAGSGSISKTGGFQVLPWMIIDPDGNEFLPKGTDVAGPAMWWDEMVLNETTPINCWKFNLIRLLISYTGAVGNHNTIDEIVNYYTPKKIVVVIATVDNPAANWTKTTFSSSTGAYQNWLRTTATKYKDNPYVWYSIVGENGDSCNDCTTSSWLTPNQQLLKVMRDDAGASNVFLSLGNTWGQEAGCVNGTVPTAKSCFLSFGDQARFFNNKSYFGQGIVYELHPYEQWNESEARLANYVDRNQAMGN